MLLAGLAGLFSSGTVVTLLVTQDVRGAAFPASEYGTECSVAAVSETDGCTCYGAALTSTAISAAICTNGGYPTLSLTSASTSTATVAHLCGTQPPRGFG